MAARRISHSWRLLSSSNISPRLLKDSLQLCLNPRLLRTMATEVELPPTYKPPQSASLQEHFSSSQHEGVTAPQVLTTIYSFPNMEPLRFEQYPSTHLHLPLRRDILHRAVVYEGDKTRQGTANTKWRKDVHGGGRKIRPQKGTGHARLGDRKSPMLRGGGVAFGPKPRDFSTELPRKVYDLAWRTALSYRYRKGELIIVEDGMEIEHPKTRFVKQIFEANRWGNRDGRSMLVTATHQTNLYKALLQAGEDGRVLTQKTVDVKNLLELGRVIIEKSALDGILKNHQSDLVRAIPSAGRH